MAGEGVSRVDRDQRFRRSTAVIVNCCNSGMSGSRTEGAHGALRLGIGEEDRVGRLEVRPVRLDVGEGRRLPAGRLVEAPALVDPELRLGQVIAVAPLEGDDPGRRVRPAFCEQLVVFRLDASASGPK